MPEKEQGILMLDIDGVLCTFRPHLALGKKGGIMQALDPIGLQFINHLCREFNLAVTISSSKRKNDPPPRPYPYTPAPGESNHLRGYLKSAGLCAEFHKAWATPILSSGFRGDEINAWIDANGMPSSLLILDDDSDFHDWQKSFLVKTSSIDGILTDHMIQAQKILEDQRNGILKLPAIRP